MDFGKVQQLLSIYKDLIEHPHLNGLKAAVWEELRNMNVVAVKEAGQPEASADPLPKGVVPKPTPVPDTSGMPTNPDGSPVEEPKQGELLEENDAPVFPVESGVVQEPTAVTSSDVVRRI